LRITVRKRWPIALEQGETKSYANLRYQRREELRA
jgi:hypothetical protein